MPPPKAEPQWVAPFLAALASCGNVTRAAGLAGVDVTGPYNRRARYAGFREAWERVMAAREARAAGSLDGLGSLDMLGMVGVGGDSELTLPPAALVPLPAEVGREELAVSGAGFRRVAASRWSKGAEERFLEELTASANVARAAAAAGFSAAAIYKRKVRDRHFAEGWEAAIAAGRARLEAHLIVAAERSFDPEALPVAEGEPKVSVSEAISILKHKPAAAAAPAPEWGDDPGYSQEDVAALREKIIDKLERVRAINDRDKLEKGWTQDGEDWVPPGWVKAQP